MAAVGRRTDVNFGFKAAPKTEAVASVWLVVAYLVTSY